MMKCWLLVVLLGVTVLTPTANMAAQTGQTGLPLPRFVSMKAHEGNVRRGPSTNHRIDWVFTQPGMPLKIIAEFGHWRRVVDWEDQGGWMHYSLLSGRRTVMILRDIDLYARADPSGAVTARFEAGVIARVLSCTPDWCRLGKDRYKGWARKTDLWGVEALEIIQ